MSLVFEKKYKQLGMKSQRLYPNEELLRFMGRNFFDVPQKKRKDVRILELGCGSGANLWMIAREGFDAYGVDDSPTGLALCRMHLLKKWGVSAKLGNGDFAGFPYRDEFFDAVIDIVSFQHLDLTQKENAMRESYRLLKAGGRFFSYHLGARSTPFESYAGGKSIDAYTVANIDDRSMPLSNCGPTCFLPKTVAVAMLARAGFIDIACERVTKSYSSGTILIEYLVLEARR